MTTPDPHGFGSKSSLYKVCQGLAVYRQDHSHWSFDESLRTRSKPATRTAEAVQADAVALLAKLLGSTPAKSTAKP